MKYHNLLRLIKMGLGKNPSILAGYLVGSMAKRRSDQLSDLDLILIAKERSLDETAERFKRDLERACSGLLYFREKTWVKLKIRKIDVLTNDLVQIDVLICEPSSPVQIGCPRIKICGSNKHVQPLLSSNVAIHAKTHEHEVLKYGNADLPFDILSALKKSLRGNRKDAIRIIKNLARRL